MLAMMEFLVAKGWFDTVRIVWRYWTHFAVQAEANRLVVHHTHGQVDQAHWPIRSQYRTHDIWSMPAAVDALGHQSKSKRGRVPKIVVWFQSVLDSDSFFAPALEILHAHNTPLAVQINVDSSRPSELPGFRWKAYGASEPDWHGPVENDAANVKV